MGGVEGGPEQNRPEGGENGLLVVVEQLGAIMLTILLTAVVLTAFYITLAVAALVYLGRRLRSNPQLAKAVLIILMGGTKKKEVKDSG
jgi:hypothetical protein